MISIYTRIVIHSSYENKFLGPSEDSAKGFIDMNPIGKVTESKSSGSVKVSGMRVDVFFFYASSHQNKINNKEKRSMLYFMML